MAKTADKSAIKRIGQGAGVAASLCLLTTLGGCSALTGMPSATAFPAASQGKIQSAAHWDVIAADIASQVAGLRGDSALLGQPLYVDKTDDGVFSRALHSMLITRLVNLDVPVSANPLDAVTLHYETQVIRHPKRQPVVHYPSPLSALAAGILVARKVADDDTSLIASTNLPAGLLAGADLLLAYERLRQPTRTEIVVTTTIRNGDRFALRKTDVYYVLDDEARLYAAGVDAPAKSLGVRGQ